LGEWLNPDVWEWFITLTFHRAQSLDTGKHAFYNYLKKLKPDANHFTVLEGVGNGLHVHSILGNMGGVDMATIEAEWKKKHGIAQVLKYDKNLGARYYMTKSINSEKVHWDIEINNKDLITKTGVNIFIPKLLEDL
jgi:hypothetical protein